MLLVATHTAQILHKALRRKADNIVGSEKVQLIKSTTYAVGV